MELRNWEFSNAGSAIAGADVFVYEASLDHPNAGAILASTITNSDGMWEFNNLTDTAKDVKVEYQSKAKWYKGSTKHSVGVVFIDDDPGPELLLNGNYDLWQRGTAARTNTTTYNGNTSYAADRMFTLPAGASVTTERSTTVPDTKSRYSCLITGAASVTTVDHGQRIRAAYQSRYKAPLIFRAYVYNGSGAAFTPSLRIGTPTVEDNFATVTNRLAQNLQSCADGAWTLVSHEFDPSAYTDIANGLEVVLRIPSGSLVAGDTVRVSQMSLRPAEHLTPYSPPDPDLEYPLCLLYAEVIGGDSLFQAIGTGYMISTTQGNFLVPLAAPKRVVPTMSVSAVTDFIINAPAGNFEGTVITWNAGRVAGLATVTVAGPATSGQPALLLADNTLAARVYAISEL